MTEEARGVAPISRKNVPTRASFVLVVYMAAYIVLGLTESAFAHGRTAAELAARLSPKKRAELEADDALEPDDEDVEDEKDRRDEYI